MPRSKANLKSRKVNLRATASRTRKNIKHANFLSRKERIKQAAIAGAVIMEQVAALQDAGIIPAPPAAAAAPDPMNQVLDLDQAIAVLHAAADVAADPAPLHRQIEAQAINARRIKCVQHFTIRSLISIFMTLVLSYYSVFPLHAAPHETSLFDKAASHLSLAGTVTGFLSLPISSVLSQCAYGVKGIGKTVRNYNARSGRFVNAPGNAERRLLNVIEYDPIVGTPVALERLGKIATRAAFDTLTGKPAVLYNLGSALFLSTYADVVANTGEIWGMSDEAALKKVAAKYGSVSNAE